MRRWWILIPLVLIVSTVPALASDPVEGDGHAKPGLQRTYNKHDYVAEKRRALEAYAQHILGVVG